ncbi:protein-tyrosine phosphatase-like protein [Penicillium canescens]|nr:protein-tyrosine phosphatase-like protein [Penicillium canescens]KAJ6159089.1 protein-tyrosine phosphatase-like protein [Penicillium canescens]
MNPKDEGFVNFREFGGYPTSSDPNITTRNGFLYRSGHLSNLTPSGWKLLHQLNISIIFCLTTTEEANSLYAKPDHSPGGIEDFQIVEAVAEGYLDLLRERPSVIASIFLHIKARPDSVFLIHCSLGKDRTGVVFALLLSLAGVPREVVAAEYNLSEEALEPYLPEVSKIVQQTVSLCVGDIDVGDIDVGALARQVIRSSEKVMLFTLQMVDDEFGGVIQYLRHQCGLSSTDLEHIRRILIQRNI